MSILTRPLTYNDLLQTPDDNKRYEIIGGELHVTAASTPDHQRYSRRLVTWLAEHVEPRRLGKGFSAPFDVVPDDHDVVQPNIVFISTPRRSILGPKRITGSPDLLIEFLSESTRIRDVVLKAELYARSNAPEYWIVDPWSPDVRVYNLQLGRNVEYRPVTGTPRRTSFQAFEFPWPVTSRTSRRASKPGPQRRHQVHKQRIIVRPLSPLE
jgi:Uma2 family endonuclease